MKRLAILALFAFAAQAALAGPSGLGPGCCVLNSSQTTGFQFNVATGAVQNLLTAASLSVGTTTPSGLPLNVVGNSASVPSTIITQTVLSATGTANVQIVTLSNAGCAAIELSSSTGAGYPAAFLEYCAPSKSFFILTTTDSQHYLVAEQILPSDLSAHFTGAVYSTGGYYGDGSHLTGIGGGTSCSSCAYLPNNQTFTGMNTFAPNGVTASSFTGVGTALTALTASNLSGGGTFPAENSSALTALTAANLTAGGTFLAENSSALTSLTAANLTAGGTFPAENGSALTALAAANISAGSLGSGVIASSLAVASVYGGALVPGLLPSSVIASSIGYNSVWPGAVQTALYPSITVTAPNVQAGSLGGSVIASSVAVGAVYPAAILAATYGNITLPAANVASGILGGSVQASSLAVNAVYPAGVAAATYPNITLTAGNIAAGGTFQAENASNLTNLNAGNLAGGIVSAAVLPSTIAYTSIANTFTSSITVLDSISVTGDASNPISIFAGPTDSSSSVGAALSFYQNTSTTAGNWDNVWSTVTFAQASSGVGTQLFLNYVGSSTAAGTYAQIGGNGGRVGLQIGLSSGSIGFTGTGGIALAPNSTINNPATFASSATVGGLLTNGASNYFVLNPALSSGAWQDIGDPLLFSMSTGSFYAAPNVGNTGVFSSTFDFNSTQIFSTGTIRYGTANLVRTGDSFEFLATFAFDSAAPTNGLIWIQINGQKYPVVGYTAAQDVYVVEMRLKKLGPNSQSLTYYSFSISGSGGGASALLLSNSAGTTSPAGVSFQDGLDLQVAIGASNTAGTINPTLFQGCHGSCP